MARCEGTTKEGARCRRPPKAGSTFCSWHAARAESEAPNDVDAAPNETDTAANDVDAATNEPDTGAKGPDTATKKVRAVAKRDPTASGGRRPARKHPLAGVAVVGVVTVALLALRRVIRF